MRCQPPAPGIRGCSYGYADLRFDHRQDAEAPPVRHLVGDEVQRPALVGRQRQVQWSPRAHRSLPTAAPAHRQSLLAIDPLNPLPVDRMALAPQQDVQAAIASTLVVAAARSWR